VLSIIVDSLTQLDEIDRQICELVTAGCTNKAIADVVYLSHQTVRNRLVRVFDVTGATNRTELAVMWLRHSSQASLR
jgi:DNA-binding NarL/FixJ family response regulator